MASNISPQEQLKAQTWLIRNFPQLTYDSKFCVTSPVTAVYNCIAWAMGLNDRWVYPEIYIPGHWWPPIPERNLNPDSLVKAFEYMGFIQCPNGNAEPDFDKVALYKKGANWTHAARILMDNEYHSKMGEAWNIHHSSGNIFEDSVYGKIYTYMKRPIKYRYCFDDFLKEEGEIEVKW